ncbi:Htur_1727 family rSAM-partnered candidate RiPP [Halorussus halobius]|uniref:Htur_1727 family rSAM-partnered candidate RiPP n=1 Tax=Halorussus halobius TaxID=1710537 RepID=UPI0010927189|nr:Htur_1727 family rSAM-partnered candidate RiPP [Halorussus halobius]
MVEKARRAEVEEPRPDSTWAVFAREDAGDPVRHVGTLPAGDAREAHAEATRLLCWYADEVWVCPSESVRKFSVDAAEGSEIGDSPAHEPAGDEPRTHEL